VALALADVPVASKIATPPPKLALWPSDCVKVATFVFIGPQHEDRTAGDCEHRAARESAIPGTERWLADLPAGCDAELGARAQTR
jgi:hypothetical protein